MPLLGCAVSIADSGPNWASRSCFNVAPVQNYFSNIQGKLFPVIFLLCVFPKEAQPSLGFEKKCEEAFLIHHCLGKSSIYLAK